MGSVRWDDSVPVDGLENGLCTCVAAELEQRACWDMAATSCMVLSCTIHDPHPGHPAPPGMIRSRADWYHVAGLHRPTGLVPRVP